MNYQEKYEKYKLKNMTGGGDKDKYLKKLLMLKEKIKQKGFSFWFDSEGHILSKHVSDTDAKRKVLKKINSDYESYDGNIIAKIDINFLPEEILSDEQGGLELNIEVYKIGKEGKNISLSLRDENRSLMRVYYKYDELKKFKMSHLKSLAVALINKKIKKVNAFKFYHYDDVSYLFD